MSNNEFYFFEIRGKYFVYNVQTTACAELDEVALSILPDIIADRYACLKEKYSHIYSRSQLNQCVRQCKNLLETGAFSNINPKYKHHIHNDLIAACLHVAHSCNLQCKYCYADSGLFGHKRMLMDHKMMRQAIDFTFANANSSKTLNIGFFGGEPLLNFNLICETVEYAKYKAEVLDKKVTFSMTSNATMLNSEVMDFISKEKFSLVFSIDGPKEIHDSMRRYPSGKGSHDTVLKNVTTYLNKYSSNFTVRGTFTRTTANFVNQVLFLNANGFKNISVEPAQLNADNPHSIYTQSDILRVQLEYNKLADVYLERLGSKKPLNFFHFDHALRKIFKPQPTHTQCGAGDGFITITPDGRIFPCFEAVVEDENCIGHIDSGFDREKRRQFQILHADVKGQCRKCWLKYYCGGGCHALNFRYNNNMKIPYKPFCEFIKYRYMLSAWILAKLTEKGEDALNKLKLHLQLE